ncbi:hypothetical protein MKQ68_00385 [Chitinophaga horti]|uniref:DUF805 domain-containing protein n=1 Tax=Chitinophaga horti TaxID=2920382 RepID=A0ABY6J5N6_9BACT|nr:hypothetical protein [Chitinophaga horti]UYQ93557.1 hypothetical protein MKQ68_00385 [Chitinophaga horti]
MQRTYDQRFAIYFRATFLPSLVATALISLAAIFNPNPDFGAGAIMITVLSFLLLSCIVSAITATIARRFNVQESNMLLYLMFAGYLIPIFAWLAEREEGGLTMTLGMIVMISIPNTIYSIIAHFRLRKKEREVNADDLLNSINIQEESKHL